MPERFCFGPFELHCRSGELRKLGIRVKLPKQALNVLAILLERPGEVVTREELRKAIWPNDTFVDFDHSVNVAINRIRAALDETADRKFIETIPRVGYRFLAPVEAARAAAPPRARRSRLLAVCLGAALILSGLVARIYLLSHARAPIRSVAVLPLANLSNSPDQEYFADGMTEALITDLAKIAQLRVISRTSAMQYKGAQKKLPAIGRELNVAAIIEGAVMRSGERVRITVQLVDATTDEHIWAETYERDLRDVLLLQSEVAQAVAAETRMRLTARDKARFVRSRVDPVAYDAYLRGRYFINRRRPAEFTKAQEYLKKAVMLQPDYALAWSALAECAFLIIRDPAERTRQATEAARRALELDSSLGEAHTALAMVNIYDYQWAAAEREFRKAIELSPNYPLAHDSYAMFLAFMGRFDESRAAAAKALDLDPLAPLVHLHVAVCECSARRWDKGIEHFRKVFEVDPTSPWGHSLLAEVYASRKMYTEALKEYRLAQYLPEQPDCEWKDCWEAALKKQQAKVAAGKPVAPFWTSLVNLYLGRNSEAIDWLEKAVDERDTNMWTIGVRPTFDPLRSDPRYIRLLQRMGLPPGQPRP
jgi:TolB-like protein/DNA-binding winged helix-turn-helix (wHTH) protein/Tfp pilus assembly protein PilF